MRTGGPFRWVFAAAAAAVVLYVTWMGMMAVHEFGHMVAAWLSGGRVIQVRLPLLGFSQTIVHPNPHEVFEIWGGPVGGAIVPLLAMGGSVLARRRVPELLKFFAGFCLIANGAYLAFGWSKRAGDAADLRRLGVSPAVMIDCGAVALAAGFFLWHRTRFLTLGSHKP